jgi:hypothetical protein
LDIHFTAGTSCERATSLAEKNAAEQYHILIRLHNEHRVQIDSIGGGQKYAVGRGKHKYSFPEHLNFNTFKFKVKVIKSS